MHTFQIIIILQNNGSVKISANGDKTEHFLRVQTDRYANWLMPELII
jgi:hypothetical protein